MAGYYARTSNYTLDLKRFFEKVAARSDTVVRKVVIDIGGRIVERSPVGDGTLWKNPPPKGYIGGRFRANWQYGNSEIGVPEGELTDIDPTGAVSMARITGGVIGKAAGLVHTIINNLPYAQPLEDGWSKQAPQGMVHLVVMEYQEIVNRAAQEVKNT